MGAMWGFQEQLLKSVESGGFSEACKRPTASAGLRVAALAKKLRLPVSPRNQEVTFFCPKCHSEACRGHGCWAWSLHTSENFLEVTRVQLRCRVLLPPQTMFYQDISSSAAHSYYQVERWPSAQNCLHIWDWEGIFPQAWLEWETAAFTAPCTFVSHFVLLDLEQCTLHFGVMFLTPAFKKRAWFQPGLLHLVTVKVKWKDIIHPPIFPHTPFAGNQERAVCQPVTPAGFPVDIQLASVQNRMLG